MRQHLSRYFNSFNHKPEQTTSSEQTISSARISSKTVMWMGNHLKKSCSYWPAEQSFFKFEPKYVVTFSRRQTWADNNICSRFHKNWDVDGNSFEEKLFALTYWIMFLQIWAKILHGVVTLLDFLPDAWSPLQATVHLCGIFCLPWHGHSSTRDHGF
jgi:hypothetical protein